MTAVLVFGNNQLIFNVLLQLCNMRNNADEFFAASHFFKHAHSMAARMVVEGAKALVEEHKV